MIETTSFPADINTIVAVFGLAGVIVVFYYSFTRNHYYEVRKRPAPKAPVADGVETQ